MTEQNPPAQWYPDPMGRFEHRYWNGSTWTEHVSTGGVQSTDQDLSVEQASTGGKHRASGLVESVRAARDSAKSKVADLEARSTARRDDFQARIAERVPAAVVSARAKPKRGGAHAPPAPSGVPLEAWATGTSRFEVAGESYYQGAYTALFRGIRTNGHDGAEQYVQAALMADPGNPFDTNAVAVFLSGHHAGYLAAEDAVVYTQLLQDVQAAGRHLQVDARVWCRTGDGRTFARVTLSMPPLDGIVPFNAMPTVPHVVLPPGNTVQVTKEDEHMDVLAPIVAGSSSRHLVVTMRPIHDIRARSAVETVEVAVDGQPVGLLSPVQAANMLPVVKFLADRNLVTAARAVVKGNALKADVTLYVAKSQNISQEWLDDQGTPEQGSHVATRPEFEWDDPEPIA